MKKEILSPLFDGGGLLAIAEGNQDFSRVDYSEVVRLFERSGVIVFRGFEIDPKKLTTLTDRFTETYATDAMRRAARFGQKLIRNVDPGFGGISLHSEASFTPAWPEVIWFYCNIPPQNGGATTLCDGAQVWTKLSKEAREFFFLNPIRYQLDVPVHESRPGKGQMPWVVDSPGAGAGVMDWETGHLQFTLLRHAVQETRVSKKYAFANHLFVTLESEDQLMARSLADGSEIPERFLNEIHRVADSLTFEVPWQQGDFAMIDNKRFLHGRRPYQKGDPRDIVIVQTARASFGYGSTTRHSVAEDPQALSAH